MCGIGGEAVFRGPAPTAERMEAYCRALRHRGPDGRGHEILDPIAGGFPRVGLAHTRLSIIDLSECGRQPMSNEDGAIWVTYNGEIYNYAALRDELQSRGHRFRSRTDTEVLVHLYEEKGADLLHDLEGMFAFVIFDRRAGVLFGARDRLGKKPLHYAQTDGRFAFCSELAPLVEAGPTSREIDWNAIDAFLAIRYFPNPLTPFRDVRKLPPGSYFRLDADGRLDIHRYWRAPVGRYAPVDFDCAVEQVAADLRASVRSRLRADVPIGAFLSGGLDSSAVVALAVQEGGEGLRTYTAVYDEPDYDERAYADLVAKRCGTRHREVPIDVRSFFDVSRIVQRFAEPFGDPSAVPNRLLAEAAKADVKVILNGDGADELFFGYGKHRFPYRERGRAARVVGGLLGRMLPASGEPFGFATRLGRRLRFAAADSWEQFVRLVSLFNRDLRRGLYTEEAWNRLNDLPIEESLRDVFEESTTFWDGVQRMDLEWWLPDDLLTKMDLLTMDQGIEARSPFLDYRFVERVVSLPVPVRLGDRPRKALLWRAVREHLPADLETRPQRGFIPPLEHWIRDPQGERLVKDHLLDGGLDRRGVFREGCLSRIVEEHLSGTRKWTYEIWVLLGLEIWFREFAPSIRA